MAVSKAINDLVDLVERDPRAALQQLGEVMSEVENWSRSDAYLYCLLLTARALRFLDHLDGAVRTAEAGLQTAQGELAAQLHLEAGMSLNQDDHPHAAEPHLRTAAEQFRTAGDDAGVAWALTSLAEALCAIGRSPEAAPVIDDALAIAGNDERATLRALKQKAVIKRQLGQLPEALALIEEVLDAQPPSQMRANALLELGHLRSHFQDYRGADAALVEAAVEYAANNDQLGAANTHRALATNDLLLGRIDSGLTHLDQAADLYAQLGNKSGRANALCERSTVRLSQGQTDQAHNDATTATELFIENNDKFGLSRAHRILARTATIRGDTTTAAEALAQSLQAANDSGSPLAVAGTLLMRAEIADAPSERLYAADAAATRYQRLGLSLGVAYANAFGAAAATDLGQATTAMDLATAACNQLYMARSQVADPDTRADHHFSSRDVVSTTLRVCAAIATPSTNTVAADLILDDFPIGLREAMQTGTLPEHSRSVLQRIFRVRNRNSGVIDLNAERPLLRQLAVALATLSPTDTASHRISMAQWRAAHPTACVLAIGAPTVQALLPIAWSIPGQATAVAMPTITERHVEAIDALGSVATTESNREMLWNPTQLDWQSELASLFIPPEVGHWLSQSTTPPELVVAAAPVLSHIPLEALLIEKIPLGVRAALRRLPVPTTRHAPAQIDSTTAYFDPALTWAPERSAITTGAILDAPTELRQRLGSAQLIVIGCHGQAAAGLAGALSASDTTVVATAADLLAKPLNGSVVLLEACWTSRYVGSRTGEYFTLATAALLAGAHSVVAGSFALPADDQCTGRIAASFLTSLQDGVDTSEALRLARAAYWADPPTQVRLPGDDTTAQHRTMPGIAPWAWAGLSAYG